MYRTNNGLPLWQPLLTGEDEGMANQKKQINIGLLGAGTVGGGVILVRSFFCSAMDTPSSVSHASSVVHVRDNATRKRLQSLSVLQLGIFDC